MIQLCVRRALYHLVRVVCCALKTFLHGLRLLSDLHTLRETLTFRDECVGDRAYDNGDHRQADVLRRVFEKVTLRCHEVMLWGGNFRVWLPPELR